MYSIELAIRHKTKVVLLLASFSGPSPLKSGLVHTVCACAKYFVIFSVKSFVNFLVHMWKIILTKNTEHSLNMCLQTTPTQVHVSFPDVEA